MPTPPSPPGPPSERTRVRRKAERGSYAPDEVQAVLAEGLVAHVAVTTPQGPLVLPMAYGHDDENLYLHGALANHVLSSAQDAEVCATVTLLDGLVLARTPFHNSMNYRCVVVRGRARRLAGGEAERALALITDHIVATWDAGRPPNGGELRRTLVLALPLAEASVKARRGDPIDDPEDMAGSWWAGVVDVRTTFGTPRPAADLRAGAEAPPSVAQRFGDPVP